MITFAELLKSYISKKHETINEVAHYTGIDHSTLYKIIKGTRKPSSVEMVNSIAFFLRLSDNERLALQESYYCTILGEPRYFGFKQITELLGNLRSSQTFDLPIIPSAEHSLETEQVLSGRSEISSAIAVLCQNASSRGEKTISIFTMGSFCIYASLLYQLFNLCPDLEFNHVIVMDDSYNLDREYHLYNLECISSLFPLLVQYPNYHPQCIYADINTIQSISSLLSEMVISERDTCVFRQDGKSGLIFSDKRKRDMYYDVFHELELTSVQFANHLTPEQLLTAYQKGTPLSDKKKSNFVSNETTYFFNPGICSVLVLDPNDSLIREHLKIKDPQRTLFIQVLSNYLPIQRARLKNLLPGHPLISTRQGLEYFVNTGYINEVHPAMMYPLNIMERIDILHRWAKAYEEHSYILVDLPHLKSDSHSWVMTSRQTIFLQVSTETGNYLAGQITEPNTVSLFNEYFSFLINEYKVEDNEVHELINESIKKLEEQMT